MNLILEEIIQERSNYLMNNTDMPKELLLDFDNIKRVYDYLDKSNLIDTEELKPEDIIGSQYLGMTIVLDEKAELHIR